MKLMTVFGTRPEVVKLAPVIEEAKRTHTQLINCSTGQHQEMLEQTLAVFGIKPDIELRVMQPGQTLASLTSRLMEKLTETFIAHKPDVVMVQGDTASAFVGALAAFYCQIPVAHVEAGLRTGDIHNPFPEEMNRLLIARLARWHFAPTKRAADALHKEGISESSIIICGNTVVDALQLLQARGNLSYRLPPALTPLKKDNVVLVTTHRRENFGDTMRGFCGALRTLCEQHPKLTWIFPVHYNPNVRSVVMDALKGIPNLHLLDPIDYETTLAVQAHACLIVTDSGGLQEEAASFGVPVVVMRETTERREGVDAGFATLAGTDPDNIIAAANAYLKDDNIREQLKAKANPYGDGKASARMLSVLRGEHVEPFHG